jgi:hypothetical protein
MLIANGTVSQQSNLDLFQALRHKKLPLYFTNYLGEL